MTDHLHDPHDAPASSRAESWVLAAVMAFLALIIAGVLPRVLM